MISKQNKLGDVLTSNQILLQVINRIGIKLGFGDKTIEEITKELSIDTEFLIELFNLIVSKGKINTKYIDSFKTDWTILYLKNSHAAYLNDYLISIAHFFDELKKHETDREDDIKILINFFNVCKKEFEQHLNYEDNIIFPYITKLESCYESNELNDETRILIEKHSVKDYISHHESLYEQLNDLKNLLIKYIPPFFDKNGVTNCLKTIFELENDLKNHELIENNILFPKVIIMENLVLNQNVVTHSI